MDDIFNYYKSVENVIFRRTSLDYLAIEAFFNELAPYKRTVDRASMQASIATRGSQECPPVIDSTGGRHLNFVITVSSKVDYTVVF